MPFFQNGAVAQYKTSFMDDSAIEISQSDFDLIAEHIETDGSFSVSDEGLVTLIDPPPPDPAVEEQAAAEAVVLQHMVREKVAELRWEGSDKQYHIGDVVYHNGSMWRATSNNSNNEPDDVPGDWEQIS